MKNILILLVGLYAGTALFAQKNEKANAGQDRIDTKYTEGASGVKRSISYKFSSSVEAADPGNGIFRYDAGNISKTGYIYLDDIDLSGEDQTKWYKTWDDTTGATGRGQLNIVEKDGKNVNVFYVTGVFSDADGYWKIPVEYVSGSIPADGATCFYIFNRIAKKNDKNTGEKKEEVVKPAEQVTEVIQEKKEEVKPAEQVAVVVEEKKEEVKPAEIIAEVKQEVKEEVKPVVEVKQEVKEEVKPVVEIKQEVKEEVKPVIEVKPEIKEEVKPVIEVKQEIKEEVKPVVEVKQEVKEEVKPVVEVKQEVKEEVKPVIEVKQEIKEEVKPVVEVKQEVKEEVKPVIEVKQEIKEEVKPVVEVKQEVKEEVKPVVEVKQEVKEEVKPVVEVKQEVKEEVKPVAEVKHEVKEEVKPVVEVKQEVKEEVKPVVEVKQEVKEEVKPVIEVKQEIKEEIKPVQQIAEKQDVVQPVNQDVNVERAQRRTGAVDGGRTERVTENRVQETGRQNTTQTSQRVAQTQNTQVTGTSQTNQVTSTQNNKVTTTQKTQPEATQIKQTVATQTQTTTQKQTVSGTSGNQNQASSTQKSGPTFTSSTINYNTGTSQTNTQVSNTSQNRQTDTQAQRYQYNPTSQVQKTGKDEQVTLPARKEVVSDQSYSGSLGNQGYQTVSTSTGVQSSFSGRGRGWWRGIIEAGYGFGIGEYGMNDFRINFINAVRIGDFSSIGLGIGFRRLYDNPADHPESYLMKYSRIGEKLVPVFLDFRTNFSTRKVTPYLALGIGSSARLGSSTVVNEGLYICPSGGIWFNITNRFALFGGIAYEVQKLEFAAYSDNIPFKKNASSISLNLGISF